MHTQRLRWRAQRSAGRGDASAQHSQGPPRRYAAPARRLGSAGHRHPTRFVQPWPPDPHARTALRSPRGCTRHAVNGPPAAQTFPHRLLAESPGASCACAPTISCARQFIRRSVDIGRSPGYRMDRLLQSGPLRLVLEQHASTTRDLWCRSHKCRHNGPCARSPGTAVDPRQVQGVQRVECTVLGVSARACSLLLGTRTGRIGPIHAMARRQSP
jgi:hypothetical protein